MVGAHHVRQNKRVCEIGGEVGRFRKLKQGEMIPSEDVTGEHFDLRVRSCPAFKSVAESCVYSGG